MALEGGPREKKAERANTGKEISKEMAFSGFRLRQSFSASLNTHPWILLLPGKKLEYFQDFPISQLRPDASHGLKILI